MGNKIYYYINVKNKKEKVPFSKKGKKNKKKNKKKIKQSLFKNLPKNQDRKKFAGI
jgi:hypothetical protein